MRLSSLRGVANNIMLSNRAIKNIIKGKWQIYEEDEENRYVYYTKMSLTFAYDEWYFYDDTKSFRFKDYKKKWWIAK